jgi:hypothetical protein
MTLVAVIPYKIRVTEACRNCTRSSGILQSVKRAALAMVLIAQPLLAGYAGRNLVIPVAGRVMSAGGKLFVTSIWITNVSEHPALATMFFLEAGHGNPSPKTMPIEIAAGATRTFDPINAPLGAVRIESNADLTATVRVTSAEFSTTFAALPAGLAVGNGQMSAVQGYSGARQYKLYIVEIAGQPLAYTVSLCDATGRIRAEKRLYVDRGEASLVDLKQLFPDVEASVVKIAGTNGSGKIIAMGLQRLPGSEDANAFEMSFPAAPRYAMSWVESASYIFVALAVIAGALTRRL